MQSEQNEDMVKIRVDDKDIEAELGANLLKVCLENDIHIPHLCYLESEITPFAGCRLCLVEIGGRIKASCSEKVVSEMEVRTDTERIRRLQKTALRLILSVHKVECKQCPANKQCPLQDTAKFLHIGLKSKNLPVELPPDSVDTSHPDIEINRHRCVLCGKCIRACRNEHGHSHITFSKRGFDMVVTSHIDPEESLHQFSQCTKCIDICPVKAISRKSEAGK